jgi:hypothetical protein
MIRQAVKKDIPAVRTLMQSEPGFWQDSWRDDVLELGLAASGGLAFVWEEAVFIIFRKQYAKCRIQRSH